MMETTHSPEQPVIDQRIRAYLIESTKWGKFLAIVSFILLAIFYIVYGGIFFSGVLSYATMAYGLGMGLGEPLFIIFVFILYAILLGLPAWFLYRYSSKIKKGLQQNNQLYLQEGFANLLYLFRFFGIFTLLVLLFNLIIFGFIIFFWISNPVMQ